MKVLDLAIFITIQIFASVCCVLYILDRFHSIKGVELVPVVFVCVCVPRTLSSAGCWRLSTQRATMPRKLQEFWIVLEQDGL